MRAWIKGWWERNIVAEGPQDDLSQLDIWDRARYSR